MKKKRCTFLHFSTNLIFHSLIRICFPPPPNNAHSFHLSFVLFSSCSVILFVCIYRCQICRFNFSTSFTVFVAAFSRIEFHFSYCPQKCYFRFYRLWILFTDYYYWYHLYYFSTVFHNFLPCCNFLSGETFHVFCPPSNIGIGGQILDWVFCPCPVCVCVCQYWEHQVR